eukprot:TRINITY_DN2146_c0_g1_i1.p2 TRINITY_DN2146_c0_g1~~TRINITY_DN2146_c0_g1_i1.p2  ORF type:complete len:209 (-),score=50.58 TRINITY_DN2146_c0_g1_i1:697-1323(-)
MSDAELSQLWRVHRTVLELLADRGYIVQQQNNEENSTAAFDAFQQQIARTGREGLFLLHTHKNDSTNQISVYFPEALKFSTNDIKKYIQRMTTEQVHRAIIVLRKQATPSVFLAVEVARAKGLIVELFLEEELVVNITKHVLVPKHTPLSKDEKEELLQRYKLKDTQLPRIQESDPVARYLGLSKGQVVKITRKSETAGRYVTYRIVF